MVKLKEKRENKYITLSLIFKKLSLILLLIILIPEKIKKRRILWKKPLMGTLKKKQLLWLSSWDLKVKKIGLLVLSLHSMP
jgi:hypothetical protein